MASKESKSVEVEEVAVKSPSFTLPNKKVKVVPVIKKGWLPTDHEAAFLFQTAKHVFTIPKSSRTGSYVNPFTPEEQECLENHPQLSLSEGDLSVHKTVNNYWKTAKGIGGFKPIKLGKDEVTLNLNDPMDYITYKVLLLNHDYVAPNAAAVRGKASYKYMIVDEQYADEKLSNEANLFADAYAEYSKVREDKETLGNLLFLLKNVRISSSSKLEWLQGEIHKVLTANPKRFLDVVRDPAMQIKLLISQGIACNAILRDGTIYRTAGGDLMGATTEQAVDFLINKSNSDHRMIIEAQVSKAK
jgi:hypothetical protein